MTWSPPNTIDYADYDEKRKQLEKISDIIALD